MKMSKILIKDKILYGNVLCLTLNIWAAAHNYQTEYYLMAMISCVAVGGMLGVLIRQYWDHRFDGQMRSKIRADVHALFDAEIQSMVNLKVAEILRERGDKPDE